MQPTKKQHEELAKCRKLAVYFPPQSGVEKEVLAALAHAGYEAVKAKHYWRAVETEMYDISLPAAEFLMVEFPPTKHSRVICRLTASRGWTAFEEKDGQPVREDIKNNDLAFRPVYCLPRTHQIR